MFNKNILCIIACLLIVSSGHSADLPETYNSQINGAEETTSAPNTYLLSYRRSGTHMLVYTISFLTKTQCGDGRFNIATGVDTSKQGILQIHNLTQASTWYGTVINRDMDYLILIVRNYKECMMREFLDDYQLVLNHIEDPSNDIDSLRFFKNLEDYDNWNPKKRLLIYYEDLISDRRIECQKILEFLKSPDDYLDDYIDNIDFHLGFSLNFYAETHGGTSSNGVNTLYHTSQLPEGIEEKIDQLVQSKHPYVSAKYLQRYFKNSTPN